MLGNGNAYTRRRIAPEKVSRSLKVLEKQVVPTNNAGHPRNQENRTVLVFFPWNLYPPNVGSRQRCLEMIAGLKEIGFNVILASSNLDLKWDTSSIRFMRMNGVSEIYVFDPPTLDYWFRLILYTRAFSYLYQNFYFIGRDILPRMRRWFFKILQKISPDIILMNYPSWNWILNHRKFKSALRVIDTHDIFTLHMQMRQHLNQYFLGSPPYSIKGVRDEVFEEDFFEKLDLTVNANEFEIYDKYDYTIGISPKEAEIMKKNTRNTKVLFVPMTGKPAYIKNSYRGRALFSAGPHPFNIQGYLYFVGKVLPRVKSKAPLFNLQVTGGISNYVVHVKDISFSEYIPDLSTVYESARFFVCPVFGGTGQQVKIIEAMAHGIPVVAFRKAPGVFPIQNGLNGLIARNAEEFADYVVQLWNDRELCRRLGQAARDTIAADFSRSRLVKALSLALQ